MPLWQQPHARPDLMIAAAACAHEHLVVSKRAAARVHQLPLIDAVATISLLNPRSRRGRKNKVSKGFTLEFLRHKRRLNPSEMVNQIQVSSIADTVADLAKELVPLRLFSNRQVAESTQTTNDSMLTSISANEACTLATTDTSNLFAPIRTPCSPAAAERNIQRVHRTLLNQLEILRQHMEVFAIAESALRGKIVESETADLGKRLALVRAPVSKSEIFAACDASPRAPRRSYATLFLRHVSSVSESPLESMMKLLLILLNIRFVQQVRLVGEDGTVAARVDFLLEDYRIVLEVDGAVKYINADYVFNDRRRDFRITALDYIVLHVTWSQVMSLEVLTLLASLVRDQLRKAPAGAPARGSWFPAHFQLPSSYYKSYA